MVTDSNRNAFLELVRTGLWEKEARLLQFSEVDYEEVMCLAEEQSVIGLVTAGLEHVADVKVPKEVLLQFIGLTIQLEKTNADMNAFISKLIVSLRNKNIPTLLLKGQGIAQSYERPLWRTSGDVDLLLSPEEYERAKEFLSPHSDYTKEIIETLEYCLLLSNWNVELHGTLHCRLTKQMDKFLDKIQYEICNNGAVRLWDNDGVDINLPSVDNDVIVVFTHIIKHLFHGGIGLRQLCDLCRLLWRYRTDLDQQLLEARIRELGLISEWKAFGALAVNWLGMPVEAMLLYDEKYIRKGEKLLEFILAVGNFGHNRELSYTMEQAAFVRKFNITKAQLKDSVRLTRIFPKDAPRFFFNFFWDGLKNSVR